MLATCGIEVAPLKGVLLQAIVDRRLGERAMRDVDLLVLPERAEEARALLRSSLYDLVFVSEHGHEVSLKSPEGIIIDLHSELFAPGRFRMFTGDLFRRSQRNEDLFGAPVRVLSPYDLLAHLIGKIVTDHADEREPHRFHDLASVARALAIAPERAAGHLSRCGLTRGARYTLTLAYEHFDDAFAVAVLRALPPDPIGDALARCCVHVVRRSPPRSRRGGVSAHFLESSLSASARALSLALLARLRRARQRDVDRGSPPTSAVA